MPSQFDLPVSAGSPLDAANLSPTCQIAPHFAVTGRPS
jgi:hypothetical protein